RALEQDQLGAAGKETRRSCFVDFDMRVFVADDAAVGWAERRKGETIRRSACRDPKGADFGLEQLGKSAVEARAPRIVVVGRVELVRSGDRLHHLRVRGGRIVGDEAHLRRMAAVSRSVNRSRPPYPPGPSAPALSGAGDSPAMPPRAVPRVPCLSQSRQPPALRLTV